MGSAPTEFNNSTNSRRRWRSRGSGRARLYLRSQELIQERRAFFFQLRAAQERGLRFGAGGGGEAAPDRGADAFAGGLHGELLEARLVAVDCGECVAQRGQVDGEGGEDLRRVGNQCLGRRRDRLFARSAGEQSVALARIGGAFGPLAVALGGAALEHG